MKPKLIVPEGTEPCPFCGKTDCLTIERWNHRGSVVSPYSVEYSRADEGELFVVSCVRCDCSLECHVDALYTDFEDYLDKTGQTDSFWEEHDYIGCNELARMMWARWNRRNSDGQ